jgi:acetyl esterase/lipase
MRGEVEADGLVHVPAFDLPFSGLASPEARAAFVRAASTPFVLPDAKDIDAFRAKADATSAALITKQRARYAVDLEPQTIAGVPVVAVTPKGGIAPPNENRVLIDLHGSGWVVWGRIDAAVEAIPIAAVGRIKVIGVDYRLAPEHRFPAASEDVAAVYQALLERYEPRHIGVYGCSAGGKLAGQSVAWFDKHGLPKPGAIGVFSGSLGLPAGGDSTVISSIIGGRLVATPQAEPRKGATGPYMVDAAADDPLAYPEASPELLARFPPTLFVTGTRSLELSAAVHSHIQMLKAGAVAELAVWEGMDHGFWRDPDLPESREAYDVIVKFFERHLY